MSRREDYLVRIDSDPIARWWTGFGDLDIPADAVEPSGATYKGLGLINGLPNVRQLLNGTAERVDFQVSGVDPESLRLARVDAESVKGATIRIASVQFDDDEQAFGTEWEWQGRCDSLKIDSQNAGEGKRSRTITLSVGSYDTGRSRSALTLFTDADQKRRSADDDIFSQVASMSGGVTRRFGPK